MPTHRYVFAFFWLVAAACDRRLSAAALDSDLRVTIGNQSLASTDRRVEIALRSGAAPRQWHVRFTAARQVDTVVAESLALEGSDTLGAIVRVFGASNEPMAVVPVQVAIAPHSNYTLSVSLGQTDPSWLCVPVPTKAVLTDNPLSANPDTVYVYLSGMSKNSIC